MHAVYSSVRYKPVSHAPRCLQIYRIGWVLFDLAPQPIDENVDRSFLGGAARARQRFARHNRGARVRLSTDPIRNSNSRGSKGFAR